MKYVIWVDSYRSNSGGIAVLHKLGQKLQEKGCSVYMYSPKSLPGLNLIDNYGVERIKDEAWIIYPEIVIGNPLNAKNVIRWVLNSPGYIGGDSNTWGNNDLVYSIGDYFKIDKSINVEGYLKIWDFKLDYWKDENLERSIDTHLIRKAKDRAGSKKNATFDMHSKDSICLDGDIANDFSKLKEKLNQTKTFISYDSATYYSTIAALCGAISVVIPDGKNSKEEYKRKFPLCKYGVAWGLDDIQWAIDTKDKVRPHLEDMEKESDDLLDEFILNTSKAKLFLRTANNKIFSAGEVYKLGFPIEEPFYIPKEYIESKEYTILRTCHGLGDWGIISSLPRKLKEAYPNCKVNIPSPKLLSELFKGHEERWSSWDNPFNVVKTIFDNNPYVDNYIDSFQGEIYNDHYHIYDGTKDEPLAKQILRFWRVKDLSNIQPEIYWTKDEEEKANEIIKNNLGDEFGSLMLSNRFNNESIDTIQSILNDQNLPIAYWTSSENHGLVFDKKLDLKDIDIRIQLLIRSKGKFTVGNQSGAVDVLPRYTKTFILPRTKLRSNIIDGAYYI
tara:strand:- start:775 stop:2448 length:1674 start_codon:yes stop_codon:yes gene_type:complete